MTLALRRLKVYLKLVAIGAVVVMVLLIVLMNRTNDADVWLFHQYRDVNVVWLILVTAVSSIVAWWVVGKVFAVIRELRQVQRQKREEIARREQRRQAEELAERERRLDEKVRRAIREET